jgi:hypothetical protein
LTSSATRVVAVTGGRLAVGLVSIYLLFAVIGRFVEGMGAVRCGCAQDCWCKRPILSAFRWVFPYRHRSSPTEPLTAEVWSA